MPLIVHNAPRKEVHELLLTLFCIVEWTEIYVEVGLRHKIGVVRGVSAVARQKHVVALVLVVVASFFCWSLRSFV